MAFVVPVEVLLLHCKLGDLSDLRQSMENPAGHQDVCLSIQAPGVPGVVVNRDYFSPWCLPHRELHCGQPEKRSNLNDGAA